MTRQSKRARRQGSSYNAIFALYWVVGNVFAWVQGLVMNKMFEKMDENQVETAGEGTLK